jgi:biofilm PGA synthesis N-glycosyltransferase PgaC
MREPRFLSLEKGHRVTVLVPAYNDAGSVMDAVRSLRAQTHPPAEIIVIDDCSTDGTARVARGSGARVLRPPRNTRSKAGAQNFALAVVRTELVMAVDADRTLAPDAIEQLLSSFELPQVAAACGFVLPRHVRTARERGRYIEHLFAFMFSRQLDDFTQRPITSGCFSIYRTPVLRRHGGWPSATGAEDIDLTWRLYQAGYGVRFVPNAVSYPVETAGAVPRQERRRSLAGLPAMFRMCNARFLPAGGDD